MIVLIHVLLGTLIVQIATAPSSEGMAEFTIQIMKMGMITEVGLALAKKIKPDASLTPKPPKMDGKMDLKKNIQPIPSKRTVVVSSGRNNLNTKKN